MTDPLDPVDLDNAIERERVAGYWRDRASVVIGMAVLCELARGIGR